MCRHAVLGRLAQAVSRRRQAAIARTQTPPRIRGRLNTKPPDIFVIGGFVCYNVSMNEKECTRCLATKPLTDFYEDKRIKRDGHQSVCKECVRAAVCASAPARRRRCIENGICRDCKSNKATSGKKCMACRRKRDLKRRPYREHATRCVVCGFEYSDVHHLDEDHKNNSPLNLVSLCPNHHRLLHMGLLDLTSIT